MRAGSIGALLGVLLALQGCDRSDVYEASLALQGPFVAGEAAAFIEAHRQEVLWLDLAPRAGVAREVRRLPLECAVGAPQPVGEAATPGGVGLVGLCPDEQRMVFVPTDGTAARAYDLGARFSALSTSADGQLAVAYVDDSALDDPDAVVVNNNVLAIVDVTAAAGPNNPSPRTISTLGGLAVGVDISPPIAAGGAARRVGFVRTPAHISVIDLSPEPAETVSAPLVLPGTELLSYPDRIRFYPEETPGAPTEQVYAMFFAPGSDLVYILTVGAGAAGLLRPTIAQYGTGTGPSDIVAYELPDPQGDAALLKVLIVNAGSKNLTVVDLATGGQTTVDLTYPVHRAHILTLPNDAGVPTPHALITAQHVWANTFFVVDLGEVEVRPGKAVRVKSLADTYLEVAPVPGTDRFVAIQPAGGLTVLELASDTLETLTVAGSVDAYRFQPEAPLMLFTTSTAAGHFLARVDLATRPTRVSTLRLDYPIDTFEVTAAGRALVTHGWPGGLVTLIDVDNFAREHAEVLTGFALDGLLGR